jgi:hypothetical protein
MEEGTAEAAGDGVAVVLDGRTAVLVRAAVGDMAVVARSEVEVVA